MSTTSNAMITVIPGGGARNWYANRLDQNTPPGAQNREDFTSAPSSTVWGVARGQPSGACELPYRRAMLGPPYPAPNADWRWNDADPSRSNPRERGAD